MRQFETRCGVCDRPIYDSTPAGLIPYPFPTLKLCRDCARWALAIFRLYIERQRRLDRQPTK